MDCFFLQYEIEAAVRAHSLEETIIDKEVQVITYEDDIPVIARCRRRV